MTPPSPPADALHADVVPVLVRANIASASSPRRWHSCPCHRRLSCLSVCAIPPGASTLPVPCLVDCTRSSRSNRGLHLGTSGRHAVQEAWASHPEQPPDDARATVALQRSSTTIQAGAHSVSCAYPPDRPTEVTSRPLVPPRLVVVRIADPSRSGGRRSRSDHLVKPAQSLRVSPASF